MSRASIHCAIGVLAAALGSAPSGTCAELDARDAGIRAALLAVYARKGDMDPRADSSDHLPRPEEAVETLRRSTSATGATARRLALLEIASFEAARAKDSKPSIDDAGWQAIARLGADAPKILASLASVTEGTGASLEALVDESSLPSDQCCSVVTECCLEGSDEKNGVGKIRFTIESSGSIDAAKRLLDPGKWDECEGLHFVRTTKAAPQYPPDPVDVATPANWSDEIFFEHVEIAEYNSYFKNFLSCKKVSPSRTEYKLHEALESRVFGDSPRPGLSRDQGFIEVEEASSVFITGEKLVVFEKREDGRYPVAIEDSLRLMVDWLRAVAVCFDGEKEGKCAATRRCKSVGCN